MVQVVVENLNIDAKHIFIVQKEHYEIYNLKYLLNLITDNNCEIVQVDGITEGAACTTLLAKQFIDNDEPLVMANSGAFILSAAMDAASSGKEVLNAKNWVPTKLVSHSIIIAIFLPTLASHTAQIIIMVADRKKIIPEIL